MINLDEIKNNMESFAIGSDLKSVRKLADEIQPIDFAEALQQLEEKYILIILRMLDKEELAEIFTYLNSDTQEIVIQSFSTGKVKELVDELYSDDLVDLIDELPAELVKKILRVTTPEQRMQLNEILKYEEESAGGIMTVNFIEIKEKQLVSEVIQQIKNIHEDFEKVDDLYVTDQFGSLVGKLELKELIFHDVDVKIEDIMEKNIVSVFIETDQEEVGRMFKRYDINTLPVVDDKNKLTGIITVDDVIDVIDKETTEDIAKLAGISKMEESYFSSSLFRMAKSRSLWLMIMLLIGTITQILVIVFFDKYGLKQSLDPKLYYGLMLLAPMAIVLTSVASISANQTSTLMVRLLSLNEIKKGSVKKIILKEFIVSLIIASTLLIINLIRLLIIYSIQYKTIGEHQWLAIGTSSIAIVVSIVVSNIIAALIPLLVKKMKMDPAISATPLIVSIAIIITVVVFFGVGMALWV